MIWLALSVAAIVGFGLGFMVALILVAAGSDAARYDEFGRRS